ncbi:hypothetical protein BJV74DRAFT_506370 [Russula compacta]|nr:hypothetical protein BJV74DRAFT_506370 [Russula compacta]
MFEATCAMIPFLSTRIHGPMTLRSSGKHGPRTLTPSKPNHTRTGEGALVISPKGADHCCGSIRRGYALCAPPYVWNEFEQTNVPIFSAPLTGQPNLANHYARSPRSTVRSPRRRATTRVCMNIRFLHSIHYVASLTRWHEAAHGRPTNETRVPWVTLRRQVPLPNQ